MKPNYKTNCSASITTGEDQPHQVRLLLASFLPFRRCVKDIMKMSIIKKKKSSGPSWNSFWRWMAESREHLGSLAVTKENPGLGIRDGKKSMRYLAHLP